MRVLSSPSVGTGDRSAAVLCTAFEDPGEEGTELHILGDELGAPTLRDPESDEAVELKRLLLLLSIINTCKCDSAYSTCIQLYMDPYIQYYILHTTTRSNVSNC